MGSNFAGLCENVNNFGKDGIFASDNPNKLDRSKYFLLRTLAESTRALLSELRDLLRIQNKRLASGQRVERSLKSGRHTSFESHRFHIRPILASKMTILGLKTPISGMLINRYQDDILTPIRI
jgi:hypothetical protein